MTQKRIIKLTAIVASAILTVAALAAYRGSFAQRATGQPEKTAVENNDAPVDSLTYAIGMNELQKIIERYQHTSLQVNGEIRFFDGDSAATAPTEKAPFVFAVEGENSLYELDSIVTVSTKDLGLIVDNIEQSIAVVEKPEEEEQQPASQPLPGMLDGMKAFVKEAIIVTNGQYKQLTLSIKEEAPSNITEYTIMYDAQSYAVKKIRMKMVDGELTEGLPEPEENKSKVTEDDELYYTDSAKNSIPTGYYADVKTTVYEIVYTQEKTLQQGAISLSHYVKKADEAYVPVGKYKKFSIL